MNTRNKTFKNLSTVFITGKFVRIKLGDFRRKGKGNLLLELIRDNLGTEKLSVYIS